MLDKVVVIIPALNEQASLPLVLSKLPSAVSVIVVDNGSTDDTPQLALQGGAIVVTEPRKGYGSACLCGLSYVRSMIEQGGPPPQVIAFVDADYSDHPDELPHLVQPIFDDQADLVIGSRMLGQRQPGAMPPQSIYGNRLACLLMRVLFGARYTDLGPFRAVRYSSLKLLAMSDTNFGWTVEMQIKAAKQGLRTMEVPVSYRRRIGVSKISGTISGTIRAGGKILFLIAKYGFWARTSPPATES